jgi:hypothetical protein
MTKDGPIRKLNQPAMLQFIKKELKTLKSETNDEQDDSDKIVKLTVPDIAKAEKRFISMRETNSLELDFIPIQSMKRQRNWNTTIRNPLCAKLPRCNSS